MPRYNHVLCSLTLPTRVGVHSQNESGARGRNGSQASDSLVCLISSLPAGTYSEMSEAWTTISSEWDVSVRLQLKSTCDTVIIAELIPPVSQSHH